MAEKKDSHEKKGLVKKSRDLPDRRVVRITITSRGEKIFLDYAKPNLSLVKDLFSIFTDYERHTLLRLINKLRKKVNDTYCIGAGRTGP
ncbi:MAG: hypothetical protein A2Z02_06840 [Chloroflexi bacterium RBG_16_48_7]|nr:MAG: hypothetical protein A2Z02_06840 [Chloroflexi bacterium RBG_16_48_7]